MKPLFRAVLAITLLTPFIAHADTLPLKRVVVTTSGLALYEYKGNVTGNAALEFPVRLDRVDDVLKSLVVLDNKGTLGGVSLPGRTPLSQLFSGLPFSEDDLASQPQLLNALRGALVRISAPGSTAEGRLLGVTEENIATKDGGTLTRHRVAIAADNGLRSFVLEDVTSLQFTDKDTQTQLDHALASLFTNRAKDQRTLTVSLRGDGSRPVGVSYIEQAPLWKTTYRLVLPQDGDKDKQAMLQGWAVLENTTGQDWKGVGVTLMSGAPVTYHQALYESYYVPRNELPLKVMGLILPKTDEGTVTAASADAADDGYDGKAEPMLKKTATPMAFRHNMVAMGAQAAAPVAAPVAMAVMDEAVASPPPPEPQIAATQSVPAGETASQMIFSFPQPVDLPAGNSLMVPFISRALPAEKIWVYQPQAPGGFVQPMEDNSNNVIFPPLPPTRPGSPDHPYAATAVRNDGASGLPPGILTLYNQGVNGLLFIGDADMPLVPKGEDRFVTFALDTKTNIDREAQDDRHLGVITIAKGILNQRIVATNTTTYTLKAPPDEPRTIIIEHPRRDGWQLSKPEGLAAEPETTSNAFRLRVVVPAGQSKTVKVTLTRNASETVALVSADPQDLDTRMAAAGADLPATVRSAIEKVKTLQAAVFAQQQLLSKIAQQRQTIVDDQNRLRENIKTVSNDSAIGKRYLKTLDEQENQMDSLAANEQSVRTKLAVAQKDLQDDVAGLTL